MTDTIYWVEADLMTFGELAVSENMRYLQNTLCLITNNPRA